MRRAVAVAAGLATLGVIVAGSGLAVILSGGPPRPAVDNYGRQVNPKGRLTELGYFVIGSALTPDGRFLWTVGAGRVANDVQITRTADGKVIQTLADPKQALQGGVAISSDGRHAYVSDTHDNVGVRTYTIDPRTGRAAAGPIIPLPPPSGTAPPDDFPPRTPDSAGQSYAAGMALSSDGKTLVVAENLDDRAAVIDTTTQAVTQVTLKSVSPVGQHALPQGVAIIGHRAFIADEGDGTVSSFDFTDPGAGVTTVTPAPAIPDSVGVDPTKTHPYALIASPDGHRLYLSETNVDRVLVLDPAHLDAPAGVIYVRRAEGLGTSPLGLAISSDGGTLFVADSGENAVRVIALSPRAVRVGAWAHRHLAAGDELARIPTGIYPDRVDVDPGTGRLYIVSGMGVGPGSTGNSDTAAGGYGNPQQSSIRVLSILQTFGLPRGQAARDRTLVALGRGGAAAAVPINYPAHPPSSTPVQGPDGGSSNKIKYVFYVVAENKTYDSYLGDLTRDPQHPLQAGSQRVGNGDPCLVIWGETRSLPHNFDGTPCPQSRFRSKDVLIRNPGQRMDGSALTPNQHNLARQFVDLDNAYADTTTSDDGHLFTASGYADDYELRGTEANNGPSPRPFDLIYPQAAPPEGFLFDALARAGISFFNYGEAVSGTLIPDAGLSPSERAVRSQVLANSDYWNYPSSAAIDTNPVSVGIDPGNPGNAGTGRERVDDADEPGEVYGTATTTLGQPSLPERQSRILFFRGRFESQIATLGCQLEAGNPQACTVPQFNELIMPNNHGAGTGAGARTPDALVRDNDLAIGQLADLISHSPIWPYAAIFVVQDDSQDGADHVDAHRISAFVISPYARHQAVDSTHYDQAGVIHTMELILGLRPDYLQVALATPLYNAFSPTPDMTPYNAAPIAQNLLDEMNAPSAPMADVSARQHWEADHVDPNLVNAIDWAYRYGTPAACPRRLGADRNDPCQTQTGKLGGDG